MFYKVIKDGKVIDVLDELLYAKYQQKHGVMVLCPESEAQAILSSDGKYIWHEETLYELPVDGYDTVRVEEIDKYEYEQLKILGLKTPEEIADGLILFMIKNNII